MREKLPLTGEQKRERLFLLLYLLLFAAVAVSLAWVQPIENTHPWLENPPDEHARYRIPLFIARYGHLPVGTEPEMAGLYDGLYAMRPSLGLYVMAIVMRLLISFNVEGFALLFAARLVNVAFGLCMAYVVYLLSGYLFSRAEIRRMFCCMVMYLPQHLFLHTYVNNESLNLLSVAMMLYGILMLYRDGFLPRTCILLASSWILCLLTNFNAYGFVLCTGILFLLRFFHAGAGKRHFDKKVFLRSGLPVICAVLIGAGWWYIRMYFLWDGDIFALQATEDYHATIDALQIARITSSPGEALTMFLEHDGWRLFWHSFVALYGSMSLWGPDWFYTLYAVFLVTGTVLGLAALIVNARKAEAERKVFWSLMFAACLITMILWLRYLFYTDFQPQARYIMPVIIPFFVFLAAGWKLPADVSGGRKPFCYIPNIVTAFSVLMLLYYVYRVAFRYYLDF